MANKEALRELQQRLADRMLQARNTVAPAAWLAVEVGSQGFLLPLAESGEIFPLAAPTPVPHTLPWYRGVVSLRGSLYGVVDLGLFLGLKPADAPLNLMDVGARLVTLNTSLQAQCAVLVDKLAGLRRADQLQLLAAPHDGLPAFAGGIYQDDNHRSWQELRLQPLVRSEHFLHIGA